MRDTRPTKSSSGTVKSAIKGSRAVSEKVKWPLVGISYSRDRFSSPTTSTCRMAGESSVFVVSGLC